VYRPGELTKKSKSKSTHGGTARGPQRREGKSIGDHLGHHPRKASPHKGVAPERRRLAKASPKKGVATLRHRQVKASPS